MTTKANGSVIDVFGVGQDGLLTSAPVVNSEPGQVPFAITFDLSGNLVIGNAGTDSVASYRLNPDGTVTALGSVATGQIATCCVTRAGDTIFASNTGSPTLTGVASSASGQLTSLSRTSTDKGAIDAAATPDGRFLSVQTGGAGIVDEFRVGAVGSLTAIGSVTVPGAAGGEGIAAS